MIENYQPISTFYQDFKIAAIFGIDAIKDTFKRCHNEWKVDYKMYTELSLIMNALCWEFYEQGRHDLSELFSDYYYFTRDFVYDNMNKEAQDYYFQVTD